MTTLALPGYAGHRPPAGIIGPAVRPHSRLPPSLRTVDGPPAARGITVGHDTARRWAFGFGRAFADRIRRRPPLAGDGWHPDEVAVGIAGAKHRLRRAVDRTGAVLDVPVRNRRGAKAAKRLPREPPGGRGRSPRAMTTGEPAGYDAARGEVMPPVEHGRHKGLNDRAESPHRPTRRRERRTKRFESPGQARRFLSARDRTGNPFHLPRHRLPAARHRAVRTQASRPWAEATGVAAAP